MAKRINGINIQPLINVIKECEWERWEEVKHLLPLSFQYTNSINKKSLLYKSITATMPNNVIDDILETALRLDDTAKELVFHNSNTSSNLLLKLMETSSLVTEKCTNLLKKLIANNILPRNNEINEVFAENIKKGVNLEKQIESFCAKVLTFSVHGKLIMPVLLKYLENKGYDTKSTYVVDNSSIKEALKVITNFSEDYSVNLIYWDDSHWNVIKLINTQQQLNMVILDSKPVTGPNFDAGTIKVLNEALEDKIKQAEIYEIHCRRQYSKTTCGVFAFKDLQYILKHPNMLDRIKNSVKLKIDHKYGIKINGILPEPELMKLHQSTTSLKQYINDRNNDCTLQGKTKIVGSELINPINIEEYISTPRDKYGVQTPQYVADERQTGKKKILNNLNEYFFHKYSKKIVEIIADSTLEELKEINERYDISFHPDRLEQDMLGNINTDY